MRRVKALLLASLLSAGPVFAGQDSTVHGSVEASPPEMLSEQYNELMGSESEEWLSLREEEALMLEEERLAALEEGDVIYLYPMEVTEYYFVVPSESSEIPG
jgi:hypothetical protein